MPYETVGGAHELASRLGHSTAAVRAIADQRNFHVPAEALRDVDEVRERIRHRNDVGIPTGEVRLTSALAIDGSYVVERVRDGLPSVLYGFAQAAAAYVDLGILETQRAERFVDPYEIARAINTALVTLDLPVAGAYTREGVDIATSWREAIDQLFRAKRIEVNRLDQTLLELLFLVHGAPGRPASAVPVNCPTDDCNKDVAVPAAGVECDACGLWLFPTDVLRIHEEVGEEASNQSALGRLMSVVELLVLVGLTTLLWEQSRQELLPTTLFIVDGPLAVYGPPAKLRGRALDFFQAMAMTTPGDGPFVCGLEKSGAMVDYARQLARHDVLDPGDLTGNQRHKRSCVWQRNVLGPQVHLSGIGRPRGGPDRHATDRCSVRQQWRATRSHELPHASRDPRRHRPDRLLHVHRRNHPGRGRAWKGRVPNRCRY
jgi:hypothetical protein